jgi:hypothetical protein
MADQPTVPEPFGPRELVVTLGWVVVAGLWLLRLWLELRAEETTWGWLNRQRYRA